MGGDYSLYGANRAIGSWMISEGATSVISTYDTWESDDCGIWDRQAGTTGVIAYGGGQEFYYKECQMSMTNFAGSSFNLVGSWKWVGATNSLASGMPGPVIQFYPGNTWCGTTWTKTYADTGTTATLGGMIYVHYPVESCRLDVDHTLAANVRLHDRHYL